MCVYLYQQKQKRTTFLKPTKLWRENYQTTNSSRVFTTTFIAIVKTITITEVRDILDYLGKNTEEIIDFLEENITATGEGFFDMFYEENHFTDEQMQTIKDYNGVDAFLYCKRLGLFCDIRTSFNAGEYNYMRIFKGEDWQDVARDIAEDFEDKQRRGKFELKCE